MISDLVSLVFEYYYESDLVRKTLEKMMAKKGKLPIYITPLSHVYNFIELQKLHICLNINLLLKGETITVNISKYWNIMDFCDHVSLGVKYDIYKPNNIISERVVVTPIKQISKEELLTLL